MKARAVLSTLRTNTSFSAVVRTAILPLLRVSGLVGQPPQLQSEENRVADMKRRVIETLQLRPGDMAADVGCGDGFYTIPLARFLGPSGKVFAVDMGWSLGLRQTVKTLLTVRCKFIVADPGTDLGWACR